MTPALEAVIERLQQMSPERQDAFATLLLREILADEQWMRSAAQNAEWQEKQRGNGFSPTTTTAEAKTPTTNAAQVGVFE